MYTLTYWFAKHRNASDCYSIIAKTKKACIAQIELRGATDFEQPEKRTLVYADAFDLFYWATSEYGGRGCGVSGK